MSDDELPPPAFCGEDCPFMVKGCEDFCPVKAYGSEVAARAREEGAKAERERRMTETHRIGDEPLSEFLERIDSLPEEAMSDELRS